MENSRNKQLLTCERTGVLRCVMTSRAAPFHLSWGVSHALGQSLHVPHAPRPLVTQQLSWLSDRLSPYRSARVQVTLLLLNSGPKAFYINFITYVIIVPFYYYCC